MATNRKKKIVEPREVKHMAIYARRSAADETGKNRSVQQQVEQCQLACQSLGKPASDGRIYREKEGCKGDWWFEDPNLQHPGPYRPELTRLISDIRSGQVDAVCVWRTDRLHRDTAIAHELLSIMRDHGVRLFVKTTDMSIHTATGFQNGMMEAAANRGYRDRVGEDIRRDKDWKASLGLITGNASCFGFRSRKGGSREVEPIWSELAIVNLIYQWFVHGDENGSGPLARGAIGRKLMAEGITLATSARGHKNKNPRYVSEQRIKTILKNPMYVGKWVHDGVARDCNALLVSRDEEEPRTAIPVDLFDLAQLRLEGYAKVPSATSAVEKRPMAGLVLCASCGRPMHANIGKLIDGKRVPRWFCSYRSKGACAGEGYSGIRVDVLQEWAMSYFADMLRAEYLQMRSEQSRGSSSAELSHVEGQLEEHRKLETSRLAKAIEVLDQSQLALLAAELRTRRLALESRATELRIRVANEKIDSADIDFRKLSPQAFGASLRRCIKWIAVSERGLTALTRWGAYIGAAFEPAPQGRLVQSGDHRKLLPPGVHATNECLTWISDKEKFVKSQQDLRYGRLRGADPDQILPSNAYAWAN